MKFTKMSLVAALLVGSSAFAIDNVKVSGDAKLYYSTSENGTTDLFSKTGSVGQAALGLGITADLVSGVSAGAHATALSTLGLEGQLVNNVWEGTNGVSDYWWMDEMWIAATLGKTTAKIGRQELQTPLIFSETWSIAKNTFEAAVLLNQDLPDTTLVGAYVGGSNGNALNVGVYAAGDANVVAPLNANGTTNFSQFYKGAYAVAAINNSFKPLTVQAWYFDAATDTSVNLGAATLHGVESYWLQADLACQKVPGLMAGIQYNDEKFQVQNNTTLVRSEIDTDALAVMLGYEMKDVATVKVAYSTIDKKHAAAFNLASTGQSKLYTESWWTYNKVTQADTDTWTVSVEAPVAGLFDLGIYYTDADQKVLSSTAVTADTYGDNDLQELTITASKSFGPLDATLAYINTDAKTALNAVDDETTQTVQAYLTLNF